jgi:hypothetical protein
MGAAERASCGRAEEQPTDEYSVVVAKALAQPATAVSGCCPSSVRWRSVLWLGPSADLGLVARVARQLGGGTPGRDGLTVIPKLEPTRRASPPHRRRQKRPLA